MKKVVFCFFSMVLCLGVMVACSQESKEVSGANKLQVVATTTMLADLTSEIGKDLIDVKGLMGPGIDPHLYKASASDVALMEKADMIVYNGLHLEGKMGEIFENMKEKNKYIVEIGEMLKKESLIETEDNGIYDPHIWFDVMLWKEAASFVKDGLIEMDPAHSSEYENNYEAYTKALDELHQYVLERVEEVPTEQRILITAHDAFSYFGKAYGFQVEGLQGISTVSEAGTADVRQLADFIVDNQIKALFIESSVPKKNMEALVESVEAKGFTVTIGGELYSDSLGSTGTEEATYIGTVKHNIDAIVDALK